MKPGTKSDPVRRWALPDRVFFGYGACAILAGVYLRQPPIEGIYAERIIPGDGFAGNHIYVTDGAIAFDFHGYSLRSNLLNHHTTGWANSYATGWTCRVECVDFDLLNTKDLNQRKMLGPDQYLNDPIPRATEFIARIDHPKAIVRAKTRFR
ncbi:MAG: hypothetical protein JKY94_17190, partial [Rhodobacteraceae bacterium]|nr:hypothetical protein [Paracoccaceae bacterium]